MGKKYRVYGIATASKFLGEFEADSAEEAAQMAQEHGEYHIGMCHQCAHQVDIGDIYEERVEEAG